MSLPTPAQMHVNRPLTEISIAWFQNNDNYVAPKVFPEVPVQKQSDLYYEYDKGDLLRSEARARPPATESAGRGYRVDATGTYFCNPTAVHQMVDDQQRANADSPLDPDRDATEVVSQDLAIKRERDWVSGFFGTGIWTGTTTGSDVTPSVKWDAGGSVPIDDMDAEIEAVHSRTGFEANFIVIPKKVWHVLKNHSQFLDRVKGGATSNMPAKVRPMQLGEILEIPNVVIAKAIHNTAKEAATDVIAPIVASNVLIGYANPSPGLRKPSAGYIFTWKNYLGAAGPNGQVMKRFRMDELEADRVEGSMAFDMKVVASELGALLTSVLT